MIEQCFKRGKLMILKIVRYFFLGCGSARRTENDSKRPRLVLIREVHIDACSAQIAALSVQQGYLCMKAFYSDRPKWLI